MAKTSLSIKGEDFYINGQKTYSEIKNSNSCAHGLLMNARFIQGVFDDKSGIERYNRFEKGVFDPDENTSDLIAALPQWYDYGLRAFTVGFQGGGPCFTISNDTIDNNPFGSNGKSIDKAYADRMDRLIRAADEIGMVVIVSFFYGAQAKRLEDGKAVMNAVRVASHFLKENGYTNVIIEIANEQDIGDFKSHPIIYSSEGVVALMEIARRESGGQIPIGCSGSGGYANKEICQASDILLIHGNGCSRQKYYNLINQVRQWSPGKPVLCNEDSQMYSQLNVALKTHSSWGYYNNFTKQEPPVNWGITHGEDKFFSYRMAEAIGIDVTPIPEEEQYYLQGLEPFATYNGKRWIKLASLYPEKIDFVDFYCNQELIYTCYDEPFSLYYKTSWLQNPWISCGNHVEEWTAMIHLRNGKVLKRTVKT